MANKIIEGIKNPQKVLQYLVLGEKNFSKFKNMQTMEERLRVTITDELKKSLSDELISIVHPSNALEFRMTQYSDISEHLSTLYILTIEFNLKQILELGTRTGESTIALLQAAHEIGGFVTSIDVNPCLEAKKTIKALNFDKQWNFIQMDDLKVDWNKEVDHLFIDTSHTFEHTLSELKKYEPLVRPGGVITLHDIVTYPEVLLAIEEYVKNRADLRFYKYFNNNGLGILMKRKYDVRN